MRFSKRIKPGHWLIIKGLALILIWKVAYHLVITTHTNLDPWLTRTVGNGTILLFNGLGYDSQYESGFLIVDDVKSVFIGTGCNGLELYALFLGFLLITPGPVILKLPYGILGVILIFMTNVVRVYLLGINFIQNPSTFEFNHKYTYLGLVYFIVFLLWITWVELINKKALSNESQ